MNNYFKIFILFIIAALVNAAAPSILTHLGAFDGTEATIALALWCLGLFLVFGWSCSKYAQGTLFPSFTLQLLIGIVLHLSLIHI